MKILATMRNKAEARTVATRMMRVQRKCAMRGKIKITCLRYRKRAKA